MLVKKHCFTPNHRSGQYDKCIQKKKDVYKLTCHTCRLACIEQNGSDLNIPYKELCSYINVYNPKSAYVLHILSEITNADPRLRRKNYLSLAKK
jgi:hypothetical protein